MITNSEFIEKLDDLAIKGGNDSWDHIYNLLSAWGYTCIGDVLPSHYEPILGELESKFFLLKVNYD